ncbi:MAG TPA: hypothetical protein VMG36_03050 [Thermoplasmata archaeon]|nr:hypothetical protein [Thermoplasmata archaeon]
MFQTSLTIGAFVGIILSGGFVYWEVGRYAAPQVPESRFDERRELFAFTAGLFVGVPLAVAYLVFVVELLVGSLVGALGLLVALVVGTEVAEILLLRSHFWSGPSRPFYALGFRAAIGGIVAVALVTAYFDAPPVDALGIARTLVAAAAVVALEVAGALLSLPPDPALNRAGGGPWIGAAIGAVGFFMLGLGEAAGEPTSLAAAGVVLIGGLLIYFRQRPFLDEVRPPAAPPPASPAPAAFGRTDAPLPDSGPTTGRR